MITRKVLLFDLGDVIWDECLAIRYIMDTALDILREQGVVLGYDEWYTSYYKAAAEKQIKHNRTYRTIMNLVNDYKLTEYVMNVLDKELKSIGLDSFAKLHPLRENIGKILSDLKSKYIMGVASNQSNLGKELFRSYNLCEFFDKEYFSCDLNVKKPDRKFFEYILQDLCVKSDDIIMVGNRKDIDIIPAKEIGMKTIQYVCENAHLDERLFFQDISADYCVDNMNMLYGVLLNEL